MRSFADKGQGTTIHTHRRKEAEMEENNPIYSPVDLESQRKKKGTEYEPVPDGQLQNISSGENHTAQSADAGDIMEVDNSSSKGEESSEIKLQDYAKKYLAEQTHEVILPSYSSWFKFEDINEIEKKALPEFFSGRNRSKTPDVYREYRDFMINTYRLNPEEYLTVTACRRNLAGDVCAIIRVHAFLEQWGLINYQVNAETRPSMIGPPYTGHFRITVDTPKGLTPGQPAVQSKKVPTGGAKASNDEKAEILKDDSVPSLSLRKDIFEKKLPKKQIYCGICGTDCTTLRYRNVKTKDLDICLNCYSEGRFPISMVSSDFLKMDLTSQTRDNAEEWTEEEVLLLLEGIEMFDDDWAKISEHVGTRSKEQCVLKFLQLPIEDPFLETDIKSLGPLQYNRIPFSQTDNPVMSVIAFLASSVNPGIAAAAAQAAIRELGGKSQDESSMDQDKPAFDNEDLQKASSVALSAAAVKAKVIADFEDREIQRLVNSVVETQIRKIDAKMNQFEELEAIMENEKKEIERQRQQLFLDRLNLQKAMTSLEVKKTIDPQKFAPAGSHDGVYTSGQNVKITEL